MHFRLFVDLDADGSFTTPGDDLSAYVKSIEVRIGSEAARAVAEPGRCTITLNNTSRYFSPDNVSSPFYGRLLPRRGVKVEAVYDESNVFPRFVGFIQRITPDAGDRLRRECVIECVDMLGLLDSMPVKLPLLDALTGDVITRHIVNAALRAPAASARADFTANPADGSAITVNGATYTFKSAITATANQVRIGATRYATFANLKAAINGEGGAGSSYSSATARPAFVRASFSPSCYQAMQSSRPVRYYRLAETSGTLAADLGANSVNGVYTGGVTLNQPGALSGDNDPAASFDGVNDWIDAGRLDCQSYSLTLEAWVKPAAAPPSVQAAVAISTPAVGGNKEMALLILSDGAVQVSFYAENVTSAAGVVPFGAGWSHVVATYDAAQRRTTIYVNGAQVATGIAGGIEVDAPASVRIGCTQPGFGHTKGLIDEAAIYFRPLPAAEVAAHYAARTVPPGLTFTTSLPGAVGNSYPLSTTSAAITLSGAALTGGAEAATLITQTGTQVFPVVGDVWSVEQPTALDAIRDVTRSERGWCYQDAVGALRWQNRDHPFKQAAVTPLATLAVDALIEGDSDVDGVANQVTVELTPRQTISVGVVARASSTLIVPGLSSRTFDFKYVDPTTGQPMGARSLLLPPEPGIDWSAGETLPDPTYTNFNFLDMLVENTGVGARVTITNRALGALMIFGFQLRGVGLVNYDRLTVTAEDAASLSVYQRRPLYIDLPLASDQNFAQSLAEYTLSRAKSAAFRVRSIAFGARTVTAANLKLHSLNLADVLLIADSHTGLTAARHEVIGYRAWYAPGGGHDLTLYLRRLDEQPYAVFDAATLGVYDTGRWGM